MANDIQHVFVFSLAPTYFFSLVSHPALLHWAPCVWQLQSHRACVCLDVPSVPFSHLSAGLSVTSSPETIYRLPGIGCAAIDLYTHPLSEGLSNSNFFAPLTSLLDFSARCFTVPSTSTTVPGIFLLLPPLIVSLFVKNLIPFLPFSSFFFLESSSFRTLPVAFCHTSNLLSLPSPPHPSRGLIHLVIWWVPL